MDINFYGSLLCANVTIPSIVNRDFYAKEVTASNFICVPVSVAYIRTVIIAYIHRSGLLFVLHAVGQHSYSISRLAHK